MGVRNDNEGQISERLNSVGKAVRDEGEGEVSGKEEGILRKRRSPMS